ncbi:MAG: exported protein of unknown function, partial [Verrucomicrobiales bacterium]|nr:exported protein of unknown function [Verrucomicrobiales bacterium]
YSNAISSGDRGTGTTIMVARNLFHNLDHAINLKANTGTLFEHNTVADFHPDFNYTGTTLGGSSFTQAVKCAAINVFVPEDGASPTRGDGGFMAYNIFSGLPRIVSGADSRINNGTLVNDVTTKLEFGGNLIHNLTTTDLGPNHPGGVLNPAYGPNIEGDPLLKTDFVPDFGSPALAGAPNALDYGWAIPEWAYIINTPDKISVDTAPSFYVGGPGIVRFKWRLDGGAWSSPVTIGTGGIFPRTGATVRQSLVQLTNLAPGPHLFEVLGQDMAGNWQDADPAVLSGPQAAPTAFGWTITAQPQVRLNEILANGAAGAPDFIELVNFGGTANLAGWRLTDSPGKPGYIFPAGTTLANETVFSLTEAQSAIGLDKDGDQVLLYDAAGVLVDQLTFGPQAAGYSLGRDAAGAAWVLGQPTPGAGNPSAPLVRLGDPATIRISEWFADSAVLFGADWVELSNPGSLPIALDGLFLSDSAATGATRYPLPPYSFIAPGGFTVFNLDGTSGGNHLDFQLDAEQEALTLDFGSQRLDSILFGPGIRDFSQSRTPVGGPTWSMLPSRGFATNTADPAYQNALAILRFLRITELMYNPTGGGDNEYVELTNTGNVPLELAGLRFVEGIDFTFTALTLAPGAQTVVVANRTAFQNRYGLSVPVAGTYTGRLDNSGETLALALPAPFEGNVLRFRYESTWQSAAQGMGRSLQLLVSATSPYDYDDRLYWQASRVDLGSPAGFNAPAPLDYPNWTAFYSVPGGVGSDEDGDGMISLLEFALRSDPLKNSPGDGADRAPAVALLPAGLSLQVSLPVTTMAGGHGSQGITYTFQDSDDLTTWRDLAVKSPTVADWTLLTTPAALVQVAAPAGNKVEITLTAPPAGSGAPRKYLRLKTSLTN